MQCAAYTERSVPLARSGRRHMRCKKKAVATRMYAYTPGRPEHEIGLCGTHLKMFDRGYFPPRLVFDDRHAH